MPARTLQLVVHYDGRGFAGWQRQPDARTVQGAIEEALERLCGGPVPVLGAGRTDAGVHARGQAAGVRVPERWESGELRRAINALLPSDVWVSSVHEMHSEFHARYSAIARRYSYYVGTSEEALSPFRRPWEWAFRMPFDRGLLDGCARMILGEHSFRAFAVQGTAPADDNHRCHIREAIWHDRYDGLAFEIEANRFLHHMVRFLVGTMLDIASGRRPLDDLGKLLVAVDNRRVSPPAPPHGLFLERVIYPEHLYLAAP